MVSMPDGFGLRRGFLTGGVLAVFLPFAVSPPSAHPAQHPSPLNSPQPCRTHTIQQPPKNPLVHPNLEPSTKAHPQITPTLENPTPSYPTIQPPKSHPKKNDPLPKTQLTSPTWSTQSSS